MGVLNGIWVPSKPSYCKKYSDVLFVWEDGTFEFKENIQVFSMLEVCRPVPFSYANAFQHGSDPLAPEFEVTRAFFDLVGVALEGTRGEYLLYEQRATKKTSSSKLGLEGLPPEFF